MVDYNVPLNEDGSLDIERLEILSIYDFIKVFGRLNTQQRKEFYSQQPTNDGTQHTKAVNFYPLKEVLEKGLGVDIEDYLHRKRIELFQRP